MTSEMTLQTLAESVRKSFVQDKREDGTTFWKTDSDERIQELCHEAHGDMMPDDWRYAFIVEALDALAECDDVDEADVEADIYTHVLTAWIASRDDRYAYCDEAMSDMGIETFPGTIELLQLGQAAEKREVLDLVRSSLESYIRALEDDEETD